MPIRLAKQLNLGGRLVFSTAPADDRICLKAYPDRCFRLPQVTDGLSVARHSGTIEVGESEKSAKPIGCCAVTVNR
jgi:hypothetical protein